MKNLGRNAPRQGLYGRAVRNILRGLLALGFIAAGCTRLTRATITVPEKFSNSGQLVAWDLEDNVLNLQYERASGRIAVVNGNAIWMTTSIGSEISDRYSYAVVDRRIETGATAIDNGDSINFGITNSIIVKVLKSRFEASVYSLGKLYCAMQVIVADDTNKIGIATAYRGERFFGLGEKTGDFELTGRKFMMWNSDVPYGEDTDPIYSSIPFYLAITPDVSYGVFADNPAKSMFYFYNTNYVYRVNDTREDIYVFPGEPGGNEFKSIVEAYTELTGRPYMAPLWGFGFHQCRYSYTNQAQVLWVAEQFKKNDLPVDSIWFDIDFMDRHMAFTYDRAAFPDPVGMNKKLLAQGIRTVAIVDPGIKTDTNYFSCREGLESDVFIRYKEKYFTGQVWPGLCYFPDFTKASTQKWWENQYKRLLALGIEGYWNDMNEPSVFNAAGGTIPALAVQDNHGAPGSHMFIHNVYGHSMIQATYTALSNLNPNRRAFVLTRSAYAGSQRYAFIWTGDNSSNWKHIRLNVSMALNIGLSGMPYVGADIGGFCGSPAPELFVRWLQLGTFIPFMRDHSQIRSSMQEPYVFTAQLDIIRRYMKLRYSLLPYLYTAVFRAHKTGTPIAEPLFLEFGRATLDIDEEFLFGSSILVAPVLDKSVTSLEVTLPGNGIWYDLWSGDKLASGTMNVPVTLENIPVYIRGGSMLPTYGSGYHSTMEIQANADIIWTVYPDADGRAAGTLYEDDGISMDYSRGKYALTEATCVITDDKVVIDFKVVEGQMRPAGKFLFIVPASVQYATVNGVEIPMSEGIVSVTR